MKGTKLIVIGATVAVLGTLSHAQLALQQAETTPAAPVAPPPATNTVTSNKDVLEFLNGDVLHGNFVSIDAKTGVHWQHPAMKEPLQIEPASVARIKLERPSAKKDAQGQNCRVQLTNGDELFGQLTALDDQKLTLETWYGGTLSIPRKMIESIAPSQAQGGSIFDGLTGLEGWTVGGSGMQRFNGVIVNGVVRNGVMGADGKAWKFSNGAFVSTGSGSIGRAFNFQPMMNIEFDLAWRGSLQLTVSLFGDSAENLGGNSYLLQLTPNMAYLQRLSNIGNSMPFGNVPVPAFGQQRKAHVSIRTDKQKKSITLVVNGEKLKEWTDTSDFPAGQHLLFREQGQSQTRISNLKITTWDGKFETDDAGGQKTKDDFVKLINGDRISGTLKGIQSGKMSFQTAFAPLEVPLERVETIQMAEANAEKATKKPGDVKLTFLDRGSILLHLDQWDGKQIVGSSPNFGQVKLNPAAFGEMQFNLDQKRVDPDENDAMGGVGSDIEQ